jgi:hypothetical protein
MAEYIEREALLNGVALYMAENAYLNDTALDVLKMVGGWLTDAPAADVVAVVRCKDCKHYGDTAYGDMCKRWEDWLPVEDDDFCSYGERRSDDEL